MSEELLTVKELASRLKRSPNYVWAMRRKGFRMIGGRASLSDALIFLTLHPKPLKADNCAALR